MHLGRSYRLTEFLVWTRRQIYALLLCGSVPVILYKCASMRWLSVPLTIVVLLGTATSLIVGFKNVQTFNRSQDAQIVWTSIVGMSRRWGHLACAFRTGLDISRELIFRHLAWLTALRYELRSPRIWESMSRPFNLEYRRHYHVPEWESALGEVLTSYLSSSETARALASPSATAAVLSMQSDHLQTLNHAGNLNLSFYLELQRAIGEFIALQANAERLKNFPYPRQYATISALFVRFFCLLLPFGLLQEFDKLNDVNTGPMHGNMVWLAIPFSVIVSWMYTSLAQVGESTENPFEGSANDVPISSLCAALERDLRSMLGETVGHAAQETIAL
ncbi:MULTISPECIES: bestrophin family ion channel [unclassified Caballeronia]|uniref:bestrophin family protein n=1 Tax=unclassified Caballeronia TaxID=2646786 RepID=UPI00285CDC00|nr:MULTISPECIES: bestrophin family ion channel [unclassified Caballeronia]MDR5755077.1 bestrophin family ion channel [Caballeronia sp. LZ024]MDR5841560.1 bestrophin family ion channel [Caballeronia sp. LZ031]